MEDLPGEARRLIPQSKYNLSIAVQDGLVFITPQVGCNKLVAAFFQLAYETQILVASPYPQ